MISMARILGLIVLGFVMSPQLSWACDKLFVQIDGILGDSSDADHQGWIEAIGFAEGLVRPSRSAGGRQVLGQSQFADLEIVKEIDVASPDLRLAVADGRSIPAVLLDCVDASGRLIFALELEGASITGIESDFAQGAEAKPTEFLTFDFTRVLWTVLDEQDRRIERGWDLISQSSF